MSLVMFDSTTAADCPPGADAYAGYTDGNWPTYGQIAALHPHARLLSITVNGRDPNADCCDRETGDASAITAARWAKARIEAGHARPVLYVSQAAVLELLAALNIVGLVRSQVRLWTAHYGSGQHICGPGACRMPDGSAPTFTADGTQWADRGPVGNGHYDQSLLADDFFTIPAPAPVPASDSVEDEMPAILMRAKGDGRWYHVDTTTGTKEYVPSPTVANEEAFLGMKTNNGAPFVEDPAYMAALEDITPGGSPKPEPVAD